MIPSSFTYIKANSIENAISLLQKHGDEARLLAGGHSLIPALKLRLNEYQYLIDISKVDEIRSIGEKDGHIHVGAGVTHAEIASSDLMKKKLAFFPEAAEMIGDVQVRNLGTIGGSMAHADPAADWPAVLLAADATVVVQNGSGSRDIPVGDFSRGLFMTALEDGDVITAIKIPVDDNASSAYVKLMQPASRFALVGCAALVSRSNGTCEKARIAFTGVAATAFRDSGVEARVLGKAFNKETIASAVENAASDVQPMSDHYASEDYRRQMAKVYAKRALMALL